MNKHDLKPLFPKGEEYEAPDMEVHAVTAEQGFANSDPFDGDIDDPFLDNYDEF